MKTEKFEIQNWSTIRWIYKFCCPVKHERCDAPCFSLANLIFDRSPVTLQIFDRTDANFLFDRFRSLILPINYLAFLFSPFVLAFSLWRTKLHCFSFFFRGCEERRWKERKERRRKYFSSIRHNRAQCGWNKKRKSAALLSRRDSINSNDAQAHLITQ